MAAITNYTTLRTEVVSWARQSALTGDDVGMIQLAEAKLNRRLRVRAMDKTTTTTLTSTTSEVAFPTRCAEVQSVAMLSGTQWRYLQHLTPEEMDAAYSSTSGTPAFYTVTDSIEFDCPASSSMTVQVRYWQALDIASDSTNWVLTNAPDIYLFGALTFAAGFLREDERLGNWRTLMEEGINELNTADIRNPGATLMVDGALAGSGAYNIFTDR